MAFLKLNVHLEQKNEQEINQQDCGHVELPPFGW